MRHAPLVLFFSILLLPLVAHSQALPPVDVDYNHYLTDDSTFTGGFGMNTEDIQKLLEHKGEDCKGDLCLKNYRHNKTGKTAAQIIRQASQKYGINPRVLIVILQKESSLVTDENPEEWQYQTAMGYGCPDDADCEEYFFGFSNQMHLAANLLRVGFDRACGNKASYLGWQVHPRWYRNNVVEINDRPTMLGSCATASLYNYTPHRVDSAWREVDGEFYYGNYNFVYLMKVWFNQDPLPEGN